MSITTTNQIELLDFLAEKFIQEGKSISYTNLANIPALKVSSEEETQLFFSSPFSVEDLSSLPAGLKILIPVVSKKEERQIHQILSKSYGKNIRIYHLNLLDRYSFLNRQFLKKQEAV